MQAPQSATGTITHEGITISSNTQTADEMKAALGIAVEEAPASEGDVQDDAAPAADAVEAPAPAPHDSTPEATAKPQDGKSKDKKRERYEEMDRQRHEALRQAEAERKAREASERRIEELRAEWRKEFDAIKQQAKPEPKVEPTGDPEPDYTDTSKYPDGQFDRKYLKDQARWEARQEYQSLRKQEQERAQAEQRERQQYERQQQERQRIAGFAQKVETVLKDQPELRARIENVAMTRPMWDAVIESDRPHELLAYMADHSEEAVEIAGLAPLAALRRMSRIDYSLETAATLTGSAPAKPKTSAHPPVSPVSGSHAAPASGVPGDDASYEEWADYHNRIERESRGRR